MYSTSDVWEFRYPQLHGLTNISWNKKHSSSELDCLLKVGGRFCLAKLFNRADLVAGPC